MCNFWLHIYLFLSHFLKTGNGKEGRRARIHAQSIPETEWRKRISTPNVFRQSIMCNTKDIVDRSLTLYLPERKVASALTNFAQEKLSHSRKTARPGRGTPPFGGCGMWTDTSQNDEWEIVQFSNPSILYFTGMKGSEKTNGYKDNYQRTVY